MLEEIFELKIKQKSDKLDKKLLFWILRDKFPSVAHGIFKKKLEEISNSEKNGPIVWPAIANINKWTR